MITEKEDVVIIEKCIDESREKLEEKSIVIFGCTPHARPIFDALLKRGLTVDAIIDNNPSKWDSVCMGLKVYQPEKYLQPYDREKVLIVCSKYSNEMCGQLRDLGYCNHQIVNIAISENFKAAENPDREFERAIEVVRNGVAIYERITTKDEKLLLCPYPGTGDVYMACCYLPEFLKREKIESFKLLVLNKNCAKVAALFKIDSIEVISEEEKDFLLKAWEFLGTEKLNLKPLLHWGWRTKRYLYSDHFKHITFNEMFKYDVFGLEEADAVEPPVREDVTAELEKLVREPEIKKGKSVIIAPYAGSFVSDIPGEAWEKIAEKLSKKGYAVFTNAYGSEKVIRGTKRIQFSYEVARQLVEYAGFFIGVRSGLCDIISSVKADIFVIYEDGFNASNIDYFGLKNMGLNSDAKEYVYRGNPLELERFIIEGILYEEGLSAVK